ncbi:MAG: ABC transporter ATP-binding protein [Chitinophagaceae bacterium]
MKIWLDKLGKRYQRHWVFRNISQEFVPASRTAILGKNGSGKSTLLRIIAGMQTASEGGVKHFLKDVELPPTATFSQVSFCAPGMDLPEELTLQEFFEFHFSFKKPLQGCSISSIIEETGLVRAANKPIGDFSSGMKQRVKLAQAIFSEAALLLLDEPCTNLDENGVQQYLDWIERFGAGKTIIVASNEAREYRFCGGKLAMEYFR